MSASGSATRGISILFSANEAPKIESRWHPTPIMEGVNTISSEEPRHCSAIVTSTAKETSQPNSIAQSYDYMDVKYDAEEIPRPNSTRLNHGGMTAAYSVKKTIQLCSD
jgi:hypothetical protein